MVRWPAEQELRDSLAADGIPRLLLLEEGPPPVLVDPLEDWIRLPADDSELWARVESLRRRWEAPNKPELNHDGVLTWAGHWVVLSPLEARLVGALLQRFYAMVSHDMLMQATAASEGIRRNSLDVQLHRLRRRIAPLGLMVRTVRKRGYVLEPSVRENFDQPLVPEPMPEAVVSFDEESSPWHTLCEISAPDRPGLLHDSATALAAAGVDVQSARVATSAGSAMGRFDVINRFGAKLTQADKEAIVSLIAAGGPAPRRRRLLARFG